MDNEEEVKHPVPKTEMPKEGLERRPSNLQDSRERIDEEKWLRAGELQKEAGETLQGNAMVGEGFRLKQEHFAFSI